MDRNRYLRNALVWLLRWIRTSYLDDVRAQVASALTGNDTTQCNFDSLALAQQ